MTHRPALALSLISFIALGTAAAVDPGEHSRALVAVPEPAIHPLFAIGLLAPRITLRRRGD